MALTFTAAERNAVGAQRFAAFSKFEITDPDGSWRDVSTGLLGVDWLNALTINDDNDQNAATLSGSLLRNTQLHSLSPFRADSLVNRNGAGAYAPMLDLWRKWKASAAVVREGYAPTGGDWHAIQEGRIDVLDVRDDDIGITGRSEDAVFLDCWISIERQYSGAAETVLQQMLDDNLGTGRANVGSSGYTVYTPISPSVTLPTFTQPIGSLGLALVAVAEQAKGFVFRFRYDSAGVYRPTFYKPDRTGSSEAWSLGPWEYTAITKCAIDLTGMKNVVKLTYADSTLGRNTVYSPLNTGTVSCTAGAATFSTSQAGVISNGSVIVAHGVSGAHVVSAFNGTTGCTLTTIGGGTPTFAASIWGTSQSLTQYKKRVDIEIDLSAQTQVVTSTNAQGLADVVCLDKQFPNLEQMIETLGFWFVQLFDYGRFYANRQHYDSDVVAGVRSIQHQLAQGSIKTTLGVAGKPAARYATWQRYADLTVEQLMVVMPYKRGRPWDDLKYATRAYDADGTLIDDGVQQTLAGIGRALSKGYQAGFTKDDVAGTGVVTFNPVFQNIPQILMRGGKAANATFPYDDFAAQLASASGFTCRAKNKNKGTITPRSAEFTASLTTSTPGGTIGPATLASAPSYDTSYTARFKIDVTLVGGPGQTAAVVAVESNDGVSGWIERATRTYYAGVSAGTYSYTLQEVLITDSSLGASDQIRLKLKSVTVSGPPGTTGSATLEGYDNSPGAEGHGVVYYTSSGPTFESKTPDAEDYIFWEAWEVTT